MTYYICDMSASSTRAGALSIDSEASRDDALGEGRGVVDLPVAGDRRLRLVPGGDRPQQLGVQARHLGQVVQLLVVHEVEAPRQRVERRDRLRAEAVPRAVCGER